MDHEEDTDQRLRWGEYAINGYAEEKAGGVWGALYADHETVLADLVADLRYYAAVHDIDFHAVLEQSQDHGASASQEPEISLLQHIIAQGAPGSLLRRFQDEPQLGVDLLHALQEAVDDSQEKLDDMAQDTDGDYTAEDIEAKRAQLAHCRALLKKCAPPAGNPDPAPGAPTPHPCRCSRGVLPRPGFPAMVN